MNVFEVSKRLKSNIDKVPAKSRSFAESLIAQLALKSSLSAKQEWWLRELDSQASKVLVTATLPFDAPKPPVVAKQAASLLPLFSLFAHAQKSLQHPKITIDLEGTPIMLSIAGPTSTKPGTINVATPGSFSNRIWFGRVLTSGLWEGTKNTAIKFASLPSKLELLAQHPFEYAVAHGRKTGRCCFCNLKLTDTRSVTVGFGPICAEHYGLDEQWANAAKGLIKVPSVHSALYLPDATQGV